MLELLAESVDLGISSRRASEIRNGLFDDAGYVDGLDYFEFVEGDPIGMVDPNALAGTQISATAQFNGHDFGSWVTVFDDTKGAKILTTVSGSTVLNRSVTWKYQADNPDPTRKPTVAIYAVKLDLKVGFSNACDRFEGSVEFTNVTIDWKEWNTIPLIVNGAADAKAGKPPTNEHSIGAPTPAPGAGAKPDPNTDPWVFNFNNGNKASLTAVDKANGAVPESFHIAKNIGVGYADVTLGATVKYDITTYKK